MRTGMSSCGRTAGELVEGPLHAAWRALIRLCTELQHGELERVKIQDGLPVLAEVVKKKVRFSN